MYILCTVFFFLKNYFQSFLYSGERKIPQGQDIAYYGREIYLGGPPHRVDGSIENHKQPLLSALLIDTVVPLLS